MKKLRFAALAIGLCFSAFPSLPVMASPLAIEQVQSCTEGELVEVISQAASEFGMSEEEAWNAFNQGNLHIQETENNTYLATYGGDVREIIIDAL